MKIIHSLFMVFFVCLAMSCGETSTATGKDTTDTKKEVKIDLPEGWKTTKTDVFSINHPKEWIADMEGKMGTKLFLFAPAEDEKDEFNENINLMTEKLPSKAVTLDMYVEASEKQINKFIGDAKILSSERITMNGKKYQKVSYTGTQGALNLKFKQFYTLHKGQAFILTLTCSVDTYDKYEEIGSQIMSSFVLN